MAMVMAHQTPDAGKSTGTGSRKDTEQALAEATTPKPERSFRIGLVVGVALAVAFVLFVVQNTRTIQFDWLFFDFSLSLWIALLASFVIGFASYPLFMFERKRLRERSARRDRATNRLRAALKRR